jgi:hypothetical protein
VGRLKNTIYARMEEMSFRSGAAITAGVLAAGVAITLAVVPGHRAAASSAPGPGAAARSMAPRSLAPASPSTRPSPKRAAPAAPALSEQPPSQATAVTTPQTSSAPTAAGLATPRRRLHPVLPRIGQPDPLGTSWGWYPWTPGQPEPGQADPGYRGQSGRHGDAAAGPRRAGE